MGASPFRSAFALAMRPMMALWLMNVCVGMVSAAWETTGTARARRVQARIRLRISVPPLGVGSKLCTSGHSTDGPRPLALAAEMQHRGQKQGEPRHQRHQ